MAEFAIKLAIGLIGIMALWLGLMQIAEKSGLIKHMVKRVQPLLRWLFPNIPKNHPAFGSISMNMAANILGLGNAATPLGIKAMQQLQSLNPHKNKASDDMCMFLALNTSSVQLLPPVTLIALMGTRVSELIIPIILATSCSTIVAVLVAKFYARFKKTS
jgi:spore maturation protein A